LTGKRVINRDMSVGRELSSMNAVASTQGHLLGSQQTTNEWYKSLAGRSPASSIGKI
jgi:inorganic pyrophosphatase